MRKMVVCLWLLLFVAVGFCQLPDTLKYVYIEMDVVGWRGVERIIEIVDNDTLLNIPNPDFMSPLIDDTSVFHYGVQHYNYPDGSKFAFGLEYQFETIFVTPDSQYVYCIKWMFLHGDWDDDGIVGAPDLGVVVQNIGTFGVTYEGAGDIDRDGAVLAPDLGWQIDPNAVYGRIYTPTDCD